MPIVPKLRTHHKIFLYKEVPSPVGKLTIVSTEAKLAAILWERERPGRVKLGQLEKATREPVLLDIERQLGEYFSGAREIFDIELCFEGTAFQKKVWGALLEIPYGQTRTYAEIARYIGQPTAVRAVGAANGRNPISIIAPCHRVIGSNGQLTGFAGGLSAKQTLLSLEGVKSANV